jgi:hypothetical protein
VTWVFTPARGQCGKPLRVPRGNNTKHCSERCYRLAKRRLQNARRKPERQRDQERIER